MPVVAPPQSSTVPVDAPPATVTIPVAAPPIVGDTNTNELTSTKYECNGCGLRHYHAKTALTCCPFEPLADEISSDVAERFTLPECAAVRTHFGILRVALKRNDPFTAQVVFTSKISCDSWKHKFETANCIDYGVPTSQLARKVGCTVAHCSRAGSSRQGTRRLRHTTRKMEPTNSSCRSCLRFIYPRSDEESEVTVYINANHTHKIGMEGLRYIHLSEELLSEVARRVVEKVADVDIVKGMYSFILNY